MNRTENQIFRDRYIRGYKDGIIYYVVVFLLVIGTCSAFLLISARDKMAKVANEDANVVSVEDAVALNTGQKSVEDILGNNSFEEIEAGVDKEIQVVIGELSKTMHSDIVKMDSRYSEIIACLGQNFNYNNYVDYVDDTIRYKFDGGYIDITFVNGTLENVVVTRKEKK